MRLRHAELRAVAGAAHHLRRLVAARCARNGRAKVETRLALLARAVAVVLVVLTLGGTAPAAGHAKAAVAMAAIVPGAGHLVVLAKGRAGPGGAPVHRGAARALGRRAALIVCLRAAHGAALRQGSAAQGRGLAFAEQLLVATNHRAGLLGAVLHGAAVLAHLRRGADHLPGAAGHRATLGEGEAGVVPREDRVEAASAQDL
mmetsp:Transcript_17407/g.41267  ORF Transcript_17407/g.41267 Transcript_17407/m.41267 type:complete len:202 (+) Transcript_17407:1030-1635(+)